MYAAMIKLRLTRRRVVFHIPVNGIKKKPVKMLPMTAPIVFAKKIFPVLMPMSLLSCE